MSGRRQTLRFERVRSFGRIMSDTRGFIRDNFVVFFKTMLFMVGPIVLLTCTLESFYQINLSNGDDISESFNRLGSYIAINSILSQTRWAINGLVTVVVVSHFIRVYREKGEGKFDISDVGRSIRKDFFGTLFAFIMMLLIVTVVALIIGYTMYGLAEVSVGGFVMIMLAGSVAYLLIRFPFWYFVFSVFFARTSGPKNRNVFSGMGLAGKVFSGNWWMTWVIFFCMWLILYLLGFAISLPAKMAGYILQLFSIDLSADSPDYRLLQTVLTSVGEFARTIVNSVFCISVALQFFSLKEKEDGEGTNELIEEIGTKNDDDGIELTY